MTSIAPAGPLASEWRQHWRLALGAAVGNGTGIALYTYISSLFIPSFQAEFGWTRGEIGTAQAAGYLGVLAAPFVGQAIDKFGVRLLSLIGGLTIGAVYLGFAMLNGSLIMLTFLTAVALIAAPANSGPVFAKPLSGWFFRNRGLALGLTASGIPLMAIAAPLVLHVVIADFGWRAGYLALAGLVLLVGLPVVRATIYEAPRTVEDVAVAGSDSGPTLRAAARTRAFWLLLAAVIFCTAPAQGILSTLAPLVLDRGFTMADAALFLSLYSAAVVVGRVGTGVLLDRLPPYHVAFVVTLVPAVGLIMLITLASPSFAVAAAAIAIIGVQNGGESDILPFFIVREFGLRSYSAISGVTFTAMFAGSAFGIALLGQVYDRSGSYDGALWAFVAFFVIAAFSYFAIGIKGSGRVRAADSGADVRHPDLPIERTPA